MPRISVFEDENFRVANYVPTQYWYMEHKCSSSLSARQFEWSLHIYDPEYASVECHMCHEVPVEGLQAMFQFLVLGGPNDT